jgi:hypothetical protein
MADQKGEVQLQSKPQAVPGLTSLNDFHRAVLEIIEEMSPCSEPKIFITMISRGLGSFGDGSLGDFRKLLGQCVQDLKARGLVAIDEDAFVIVSEVSAEDEDILARAVAKHLPERLAELEQHPAGLGEASTNQKEMDPDDAGVTDGAERAPELPKEDMNATSSESAEDVEILDPTAEFEQNAPRPNEASTSQGYAGGDPNTGTPQTQAEVTDDAEHVAELTREEIIAAMRQFISDDQADKA